MTILKPKTAERIKLLVPINKGTDPWLIAYWTKGGTYVIASNGSQTDDERPHDLAAIVPGFTSYEVHPMRPTASPDLITELEALFK